MRVECGEVYLVVEGKGAVVEVGAADDGPLAVDGHELGVDHGGLVLEDVGAAGEQVPAGVATEPADDGMIDLRAGGEDFDAHGRDGWRRSWPGGAFAIGQKVGAW